MSYIEYIIVFHAILVGFVISEFMQGWSHMIKFKKRSQLSWIHLSWTIILFIFLILEWWMDFQYRLGNELINPAFFILYLLRPLIVYFILKVIFDKGVNNYVVYFEENLKKILILLLLYWSYEIFFSFVKAGLNLTKYASMLISNPVQFMYMINVLFLVILLFFSQKRILLVIYTILSFFLTLGVLWLASSIWYENAKTLIG